MEEIDYEITRASNFATPTKSKRKSRGSAELKNKSNHGSLDNKIQIIPNQERKIANSSSSEDYEDNGWNKKTNELLLFWLEKTLLCAKHHSQRTIYLRKINLTLMLIYIALGPIGSILSSLTVGTTFFESPTTPVNTITIPSIIVAVITMSSSILAGIIAYLKLAENISKEKAVTINFESLARDMERVAAMDIDRRPNALTFLNEISEKFTKYQETVDVIEVRRFNIVDRVQQLKDINERVITNYTKLHVPYFMSPNSHPITNVGISLPASKNENNINYPNNSTETLDSTGELYPIKQTIVPPPPPTPKNNKSSLDKYIPETDYKDQIRRNTEPRNKLTSIIKNSQNDVTRSNSVRSIKEETKKIRSDYRTKKSQLQKSNSGQDSASFIYLSKSSSLS